MPSNKKRGRQLNMFETQQTIAAKNIIRKELLRFKDNPNQLPLVYAIIYRERMVTRSPDRRIVFERWLSEHAEHVTYIAGRSS